MKSFVTASGSVYEVDQEKKQVRRLNGVNDPTPRQGQDGEWRTYKSMTPILVDRVVIIVWDRATTPLMEGSPEDAIPTTMTSPIKEIIE